MADDGIEIDDSPGNKKIMSGTDKLTQYQWKQMFKKIDAGETITSCAREYRVAVAVIRKRLAIKAKAKESKKKGGIIPVQADALQPPALIGSKKVPKGFHAATEGRSPIKNGQTIAARISTGEAVVPPELIRELAPASQAVQIKENMLALACENLIISRKITAVAKAYSEAVQHDDGTVNLDAIRVMGGLIEVANKFNQISIEVMKLTKDEVKGADNEVVIRIENNPLIVDNSVDN